MSQPESSRSLRGERPTAALVLVALVLAGCVQYRDVGVNFGDVGEGLDGFLCKDPGGKMLLDRLGGQPDAGMMAHDACLVTDFIRLQGLPGCRTGQLMRWCNQHECKPLAGTRKVTPMQLPSPATGLDREVVRAAVAEQLAQLKGTSVIGDAPGEGAILRVLATAQPCDQVKADDSVFDTTRLVGCAYSCPTEFDRVSDSVYLGFETLTASCDQGVRICADGTLTWKP